MRLLTTAFRRLSASIGGSAGFGIALLFAVVALAFTAPAYRNTGNWGIQDWDIFLFYHGAPAVTVTGYQQVPLWNPWFCGGMPMLARPESPQLSPMFLITLLLGTVISLKVQITLHLVIGLAGTYALARHRAASRTAAILAAFVYMLGGTYTLHMTVGNAWAYTMAFIPWAVLFWLQAAAATGSQENASPVNPIPRIHDPDVGAGRPPPDVPRSSLILLPSSFLCALTLVLMWLGGGPYPMVLTLLFLAAHGLFGIATRELRPWPALRVLVTVALLTFGLGAIKFLPAMEFMGAYPRTSDMSTGFSIDSLLHGLFGRDQTLHAMDALRRGSGFLQGVSQGINETGAYIGILPFLLFLIGTVAEVRQRRFALLLCFVFFLWLSFGVRAPVSAWNALHDLPVFSITRVAERFRMLFLLVLAFTAASGLDTLTAFLRRAWRNPWPSRLLPPTVLALVWLDLMRVVSPLLGQAFTLQPLEIPPAPGRAFAQTASHYSIGPRGWATESDDTLHIGWSSHFPALQSNLGVILGNEDTPVPKEAVAADAPNYRGEVYVYGAGGQAAFTYWSPNVLKISAQTSDDGYVVVNQNYYPGWHVKGVPDTQPEAVAQLLAVRVGPGHHNLTLYYRPASFLAGAGLSLATLLACIWWLWRARRGVPAPAWFTALAARVPRHLSPATRVALALAAATLIVYLPALQFEFVNIDDDVYVTENPHVKTGLTLANVRWAFTATERSNYWHPLTWISHMLDVEVHGLRAGGHHLTNVLLHVLNAVLLFLVLRGITTGTVGPWALLPPALVAALFALHPLHVESVAWVAERKDVLSTFFWLLTLGAYGRYARAMLDSRNLMLDGRNPPAVGHPTSCIRHPASRWYVATLALFACGLMSKPMLVTLPFVLLLLDYWPLRRWAPRFSVHSSEFGVEPSTQHSELRTLLLEKVPFLLLTLVASVWAFVAQREGEALRSLAQVPPGGRIANALVSYVVYLGKTVWPHSLTVYYPLSGKAMPLWQPMGAAVLLLAITGVVLWQARRRPYLLTGWFWYLITLLPVIGLVQIGTFARADRYTYVPLVGVFIMVAWGLGEVGNWKLETRHSGRPIQASAAKLSVTRFLLLVLLACAVLTWRQLGTWQNSTTLFTHNLRAAGNNAVAQDGLGYALLSQGNYAEAVPHFEESVRLLPGAARTRYRLGRALAGAGRLDEAITAYEATLAVADDFTEAWINLGVAVMQPGNAARAADCFRQAVKLEPDNAEAHSNLGIVLCGLGQLEDGLQSLKVAVQLKPDNAESRNNLGRALAILGRLPEAEAQLKQAVGLKPDYREAHQNLADVLARLGRQEEAQVHAREATNPEVPAE